MEGEEDEGDMAGRRSVSMVELDWGGNDAERENTTGGMKRSG